MYSFDFKPSFPSPWSISVCQVILYSEPDYQGECHVFDRNQEAVPEKLLTKSCRVSGGRWGAFTKLSEEKGNNRGKVK